MSELLHKRHNVSVLIYHIVCPVYATAAMRGLPVGAPKVIVSTVRGGGASSYTVCFHLDGIPLTIELAAAPL